MGSPSKQAAIQSRQTDLTVSKAVEAPRAAELQGNTQSLAVNQARNNSKAAKRPIAQPMQQGPTAARIQAMRGKAARR